MNQLLNMLDLKLIRFWKIVFSFTDGDGDIGLDQNILTPPHEPGNFYYYNLYITYYELMDGQWIRATADPLGNNSPFADSITYSYRIENISNWTK